MNLERLLAWLVGAAALGVNVHAVAALVLGVRSRSAGVIARYAWRCGASVIGFAFLVGGSSVASFLEAVSGGFADPSQKATLLGKGISELINGIAFTVLVGLLPAIATAVLSMRAHRASARRR